MALRLGLDLGGTNIKAALVDDEGWEIVGTGHIRTDRSSPGAAILGLADYGRYWIDRHPDLDRVGVAVPGHFDPIRDRATVIPNIPGDWSGEPVHGTLERAFARRVAIINDARAFGLAENRLGAAQGFRDVLAVVLGTGVGGALILGGELYQGLTQKAGEIGHQVLDPDGLPCGCGNRGCLETFVKASTIASNAGFATVDEAVQAACGGNEAARSAFVRAGTWLGIGIANVVTVLTPQAVVVGGGVAQAGDLLFQPLEEELLRRTPLVSPDSLAVLRAELGTIAGAVGAAVFASDLPTVTTNAPVSMTQRDPT